MNNDAILINNEQVALLSSVSNNKSRQCPQFLLAISFFAIIGGFLFGYDTGIVSGAILFLNDEFSLTRWETESVVSIALLGAMIGSAFGGQLADYFGRRLAIIFASILFIVGSVGLGISTSFPELLAWRSIIGAAIGIAAAVVPVYLGELAPAESRGALVTTNNLAITTGQFISYLVASGLALIPSGWRLMFGLAAIPAVVQLVGVICILPESPRWLVQKNRSDAATKILSRLRGKGTDSSVEIQEIISSVSFPKNKLAFFSFLRDLIKKPSLLKALLVGSSLQIFQQLCGINTAMYYSATILKFAGFKSNITAIFFSDAVAFANALFTVVSLFLIDKVGRRSLLLVSIFGATIGMVALGFSFWFATTLDPKIVGITALCSLSFFVAFFAIGLVRLTLTTDKLTPFTKGPIPWCVNSEIYPPSCRGIANGIATTTNWTANLLVSMTFLSYIHLVGTAVTFWTFAAIGIVAFILFWFILPETKGKSIEEINNDLF